jgi:hypothetical protein
MILAVPNAEDILQFQCPSSNGECCVSRKQTPIKLSLDADLTGSIQPERRVEVGCGERL